MNTGKVIWLIKGQQWHMASWCHNSPVNNSIDVQQLLLSVSAASMLIPERPHLSISVYHGNCYFAHDCVNQPYTDREKLQRLQGSFTTK